MKIKNERPVATVLVLSFMFLLFAAIESCKTKDDGEKPREPIEAPKQIISVEQARTLWKNYSERRVPLIQRFEDSIDRGMQDDKMQQKKMEEDAQMQSKRFDVARYVAFDLDSIKQYIAYIEQEAKLAGEDISSLRLYFSNYADQKSYQDGRAVKHPRQNTLFFAPTIQRDDLHFPYFIEFDGDQRKAVLLSGDLQPHDQDGLGSRLQSAQRSHASLLPEFTNSSASSAINMVQLSGSQFYNEGSSAPPPNN